MGTLYIVGTPIGNFGGGLKDVSAAEEARISVTLLHAMRQRGAEPGLATLCIRGGMGMALVFQQV